MDNLAPKAIPHHEDRPWDPAGAAPLSKIESGTLWRNERVAGVELFRGDFQAYSFTRHFHSEASFGAMQSGVMRSWHRDGNYTLQPDTVILFNPGDVHAPFPADSRRWSFRMFYLQDEVFERLSLQISATPIRFTEAFRLDPQLADKILELHKKLEGHCEAIEFECRILSVLEHVAQRHAEKAGTILSAQPSVSVARMREYIHAHAEEQISLETLAKVGHMSMYHALRSFREALGLPPHKYLLQVRIERAKQMLQRGEPIVDVASTLGFSDQSHLTRNFKRVFGVSPAQSLRRVL